MRKIAVFLIFVICFLTITAFGETTVKVTYNGNTLTCDVPPYIENSRTLIPVRMAEQLGYLVEWDEKNRTVNLEKGDKTILLKIDSSIAEVSGKKVTMDVPAAITQSRTFVPVRFVSENFGYNVDWDSGTRTVLITDPVSVSITNVTTEKTQDELLIKLFADKTIENVETMVLENPKRYVYDIKNAVLSVDKDEITVNSDIIKSVRYSQFSLSPYDVRIVVELKQDTTLTAKYINGLYTISVLDGGVPTVTSLKLTEGENTASVYMTTDMTLNYSSYKLSNPSRYVVELPDADIAAPDLKGSGEVIEKAELTRKDGVTKLTIYLAGAVSATKCYITSRDGNIVVTANLTDTKEPENSEIKADGDFLIVIDPGHGGDEPGSLGKINGEIVLYEKDINLKIGKRVYEILLERGYNVIATRTDDSTVSLMKRVEIANESNADLFVSVHNNSFTDSSAKGTLTMYAYDTPKSGHSFSGKDVAGIIQPYLAASTGSTDRKLMENSKIYVNAKTNMPAVLCECLFMSNPEDLGKLMDEAYAEKIAKGIADGICEAVKQMKS